MDYEQCKVELCIWPRCCRGNYDHIAVHVYALLIVSKEPQGVVDDVTKNHHFKLKGTGPISYYPGCVLGRDRDGTLHFVPRKHIEKWRNVTAVFLGQNQTILYVTVRKGSSS